MTCSALALVLSTFIGSAVPTPAPWPTLPTPQDPGAERNWAPGDTEIDPDGVEIEFDLAGSRPLPVVEAIVNGKGPYLFIFDTGASLTVLDEKFVVEELGLELGEVFPIGDPSGAERIPARHVHLDYIELGSASFGDVDVVAFDRSRFDVGRGLMGVLGLPLLSGSLFTLDYPNQTLRLHVGELPESGAGVAPYETERVLPGIKLDVAGLEHSIHIDSGSPGGFTLPKTFVDQLELKGEPKKMGMARTVNNEFVIWSAELDGSIWLAGHEFVEPEIQFNDQLPAGIIGYRVLKDFAITFDQVNHRVRFAKPGSEPVEAVAKPAAKPRSIGLIAALGGPNLEVRGTTPGSPAERAGLLAGDSIVEINGKAVGDYAQADLRELFAKAPKIVMTIERDGKRSKVEIPLDGD